MYKLITSFIYAELIDHESKFKFMQIDQRGGVKVQWGVSTTYS